MTPNIAAKFSKTIGFIIFSITGLTYVNTSLTEPVDKVVNVGLSAFAAIAVLSGLCFALVSCLKNDKEQSSPLYAGEKFLHSGLLIIQTVFIKYFFDRISNFDFLKTWANANLIFKIVTNLAVLTTGMFATYFSIYAFQSLNDFLWDRYTDRRKKMLEKK